MPKLLLAETEAYLAERGHFAHVGTLRADGWPIVLPVGYLYQDGMIMIVARAKAGWLANLRRDPRVCVSVHEDSHPCRKVTVVGQGQILFDVGQDDQWRAIVRAEALQYSSEPYLDAYLEATGAESRLLVGVDLRISDVTTWRLPTKGEDPGAAWARRYYDRKA